MPDVFRAIAAATAAGDLEMLSALANELAAQVAGLELLRDADIARKAGAARRTAESRNRKALSRDVTLHRVTPRDSTSPPPPLPSSSSPTPLITTSFPTPTQHSSAREPEEQKLLERAPLSAPVISRMLDACTAGVQRISWVGRLHGVLDRPPHPSDIELRDALEDMLTKARDQWGPAFLRACVHRIRTEGAHTPAGKTPETRGSVILALGRRYDLFTYGGDAAAYEAKLAKAALDPQAGARFRAEISAVEPWRGVEGSSDFFRAKEVDQRLAAAGVV